MDSLPTSLYESICRMIDDGDRLRSASKYEEAIASYEAAVDSLPAPKEDWDIFTTITVSIGDAYYENHKNVIADSYYAMALKTGDGVANPYVWYAKGRNLIKLGEIKAATDALMRAYMLDGDEVFKIDNNMLKPYIEDYIRE